MSLPYYIVSYHFLPGLLGFENPVDFTSFGGFSLFFRSSKSRSSDSYLCVIVKPEEAMIACLLELYSIRSLTLDDDGHV